MANKAGAAVYQGLLDRGFSAPQAAALAGNIQAESSFSPTAWNGASSAGGLMQWRLDRLAGLQNYAKATGRSASDPNAQLDFVVHEMTGPEAGNAKAFLAATDVPSANAALKSYIRYGDNEAGNRLQYALGFGGQPTGTPALNAANEVAAMPAKTSRFVNPTFSGGTPDATASAPNVVPLAPAPAKSTGAVPTQSDDDLLNSWSGNAPSAPPAESAAAPTDAANKDEALLSQWTKPESPSSPQTPGALGNNPMAVHKPPANPTAADYQPSSLPFLDPVGAFATSAINAVPVAGPLINRLVNWADANTNNLLGFPTETPDDRAALNQAQEAKFPLASTAGSVAGAVAPLALGAGTALGGKLLGTSGNLLTRTVAGGLSSGALGGADALARGASPLDAGHTAMTDLALGGAMAPLGSALAGGGKNMLLRAGTGAAAGAAIGGAGTLAAGGDVGQAEHNALMGAGVGTAAGVGGSLANRLIAAGTSPEVAQLAQLARNKYGIPVGPGQISTNAMVNKADTLVNKIPLSGGTASSAAQNAAFSGAIAKEMGSPGATSLGPSVMGPAKSRISGVFQQVAKNTASIPADTQFDNDTINAMAAAQNSMTPQQFAPLNSQFNDIMATFKNGNNAISGTTYLKMTERGSPLDAAIHSTDPAISHTAGQLKEALDSAMQRAATPEDAAALKTARYEWKVLRTVEDMAEKAGDGPVSPALLMGAVRKNFPSLAYDGGGNMGELANIGQRLLKPQGTSNTAENLKLMGGVAGLGDLLLHPEHIPAAAGIAAGVLGAGRLAGTALRSDGLANMLINGGLGQSQNVATPTLNMLMRAAPPALQAPALNNLLLGPGGYGDIPHIVVRGASPAMTQ